MEEKRERYSNPKREPELEKRGGICDSDGPSVTDYSVPPPITIEDEYERQTQF